MALRKKTLNLDQRRIDKARQLLHASTDTEAIHTALDRVISDEAIFSDMMSVAGKGRGLFRDARRRRAAHKQTP